MSAETRPCHLLCAGAVHIADIERAVVDGTTGCHVVQRIGETWNCDCAGWRWHGRCAHVAAIRLLTTPPQPDGPEEPTP